MICSRNLHVDLLLILSLGVVVVKTQDDFATFDQCGVETAAEKGIVKSPNYPATPEEKTKYPNDQHCLWKVDVNDPNTLYAVRFFDLVTQHRVKPNNVTICQDYVNITTESGGTEQYCGFTKPEDIYSGVGPKLEILFISDAMYTYRGFMLAYQAFPGHDPCKDEPCINGDCVVTEDRVRYECDCEAGFTGFNCQADINECESEPCRNEGTCEQTEKPGYECFCTEQWQGIHCEIVRPPDPCLSNPCRNEGTCTASDTNEEYFCACVVGYTGSRCRSNIDECESNPCQNESTCEDRVNEYECTCARLYYGSHCENKQKINGCLEQPCTENGDCITTDDEGGYHCECIPGWTGEACEADFEECSSNPCQNGGICNDTAEFNRFDCTCVNGYKGELCEIAPPMCRNPGIPDVEADTEWIVGSTLKFHCIEGYILQGSENLTCLKNESWSTTMPECIVDKNMTSEEQTEALDPWLGTMLVLSGMFALTLIALVAWVMLNGPWNIGPNVTKIMSISRASLPAYDPYKEC